MDVTWQCPNCGKNNEHSTNVLSTTQVECEGCESEVSVDVYVEVESVQLIRKGPEKSGEEE